FGVVEPRILGILFVLAFFVDIGIVVTVHAFQPRRNECAGQAVAPAEPLAYSLAGTNRSKFRYARKSKLADRGQDLWASSSTGRRAKSISRTGCSRTCRLLSEPNCGAGNRSSSPGKTTWASATAGAAFGSTRRFRF